MRIQRDKKRKTTTAKRDNNGNWPWGRPLAGQYGQLQRVIGRKICQFKKRRREREKKVLANSENENKTMTKATNNKLKQLIQNVR